MAGYRPGLFRVCNPAIYLISLLPGLGVWLLAGPFRGDSLLGLIFGTVAVGLLQHTINLLNDVSDWDLGADTEKYDSWVRFHRHDTRIASLHGWVSFLLGGLLGLAALTLTDKLWILAIASPMLVLGYLYNSGPRPLSYTHLGEWVTGLCYGPGVFGCLWLLANDGLDGVAILGMVAFAALATSLLLSHQTPQIETDRRAGKQSFAVRYGAQRTRQVARALFVTFLSCFGCALWLSYGAGPATWGYCAAALPALAWVMRVPPRPPVILLPSAGLLLVTLVVRGAVI